MSWHWSDCALGLVLLAAGVALMQVFVGKPLEVFLGSVVIDDAFYYLVPAQHFLQGLGTSFDGVNPTNGYHPLWMLVAIAGVWLAPDALEVHLLPALSSLFYILGALALSLYLFPKQPWHNKALIFSVFCFNFYVFKVSLMGLENGLSFFILCALLVFLQKRFTTPPPPRNKGFWLLGGLLALLALSRVDQILFAFFIFAVLLYEHRKSPQVFIKQGLQTGLPILILFGGYLCLNKLVFGTFLPISGHVKAFYEAEWLAAGYPNGGFLPNILHHFTLVSNAALKFHSQVLNAGFNWITGAAHPDAAGGEGALQVARLSAQPHWLVATGTYGLVICLAVGGGLCSCYKVWRKELSPYYLAFVAFAVCHLLVYAVRLPHFTLYGFWYFTPEFLVILLSLYFGIEACLRCLQRVAGAFNKTLGSQLYAALALLFCAISFLAAYRGALGFAAQEARENRFHQAAIWINDNLPEHSTIGAHSAGTLGFFVKNRQVINLDGLVNSAQYLQVLKENRFQQYALQHLDYYADYSSKPLDQAGICWAGCIPPENLELVKKWQLDEASAYYILKILP